MTEQARTPLVKPSVDPIERRRRLHERMRQAFLEGAEEDSQQRLGRGLTSEELERVLRRYPEDE